MEAAVKLTVVVPAPGAAIVTGLKLTVTPVGAPLAVKPIDELKLFTSAVVSVSVLLLPCITPSEVAEGVSVKLAVAETVSVTVTVLVTPPPLPSA